MKDIQKTKTIFQKYRKLSNKNIIFNFNKNYKINPFSQVMKNSPLNLSTKSKHNLSLNISDKKNKSKSNFFNLSKKYFIKEADCPKKEEETIKSDININESPIFNKKLPLSLKKKINKNKNIINYIPNYPKTFYQKISSSIQKMKIQADKTLQIMKKNLKISNKEVFHRTTSVINIHKLEKFKTNKENDSLNNYNEKNNLSHSYLNIKNLKTSKPQSSITDRFNIRNNLILDNHKLLGLSKIPSTSFHNIKKKHFYIPLFNHLEINKNYYKNMYHYRSFEMKEKMPKNKIYDTPFSLIGLTSYIREPEIQLKFIYNKIKLILDNIKYFKTNYMFKKEFKQAFINMENPIKAEFNYIIEELCSILIRLIPQLLKGFYNSLDQLLFINIPGIDEEMQKQPSNEIECLKYNINFFIKVSDYFEACVDIYNIIQKQIAEFKYTNNEFQPLNSNLDFARYDSTRLISMADSYIKKTKNDENVFSKFEIGLKLKKNINEEKEEIDAFERFHKRRRIKITGDIAKIERINSALNIGAKGIRKDYSISKEKRKKIKDNKNLSILNSSLIKDMMKYFNKSIKEKIISQQVIERFKYRELKRLGNTADKNNSFNEIN